MKRYISLILAVCMAVSCVSFSEFAFSAVTTICDTYTGENVNKNDYLINAETIKSYLYDNGSGLMRVQADAVENNYLVEYYDYSFNIQKTVKVKNELPVFGCFYASDNNFYILSGQENLSENDSVETFRITKYDKQWKKINSDSLYGANTILPFEAGSASMYQNGNYLYVRTCHQMYAMDDGLNHQTNMTFIYNISTGKITDSCFNVESVGGYVSHSFNQIVRADGNNIVAVDHGDAYPRSIVFYSELISNGKFQEPWENYDLIDLYKIDGAVGDNVTGVSVGGFEVSDKGYITAFDAKYTENEHFGIKKRNVYIAFCSKSNKSVTLNKITNYADEKTSSTPQLVKLNENKFILLWKTNNTINYTELDANGKQVGSILTMQGDLSDCQPIVAGNKIVWYTWKNNVNTFYQININNLYENGSTVIKNGHDYEIINASTYNNKATRRCKVCKHEETFIMPDSFEMLWKENTQLDGYYKGSPEYRYDVGANFFGWAYVDGIDNDDYACSVEVSDENIVTYEKDGNNKIYFKAVGEGKANVTIYLRYRPSVSKVFTINVAHNYDNGVVKRKADYEHTGLITYTCRDCGHQRNEETPKIPLPTVSSTKTNPTEPVTTPTKTNPTTPSQPTVKPDSQTSKTTVSLKKSKATLYVKQKTTISPVINNPNGKTTFTSSNKAVARVNSKGTVTALKKGNAVITVKNNGVKKRFVVTVKNPKLNKSSISLKRGKSFQIKITGKLGTAKFSSNKKSVVTVSKKGKITAREKGKAVIVVKTNGITLKLKVAVK